MTLNMNHEGWCIQEDSTDRFGRDTYIFDKISDHRHKSDYIPFICLHDKINLTFMMVNFASGKWEITHLLLNQDSTGMESHQYSPSTVNLVRSSETRNEKNK